MKNKTLLWMFILSFLFWLFPFIIRIFLVDIPDINTEQVTNHNNITGTMDKISQLLLEKDMQNAFLFIFVNNLKGCILNILGGIMLGLGTLINLMFNGFFMADIFVSSYKAGLSIGSILKLTLPHSFELIGFWLSGGIGFYIAWNIFLFMRGKEGFTTQFYRTVGIGSLAVFIIILSAAYVETYISVNMLK